MNYRIAKSLFYLILKAKKDLSGLHPVRVMAYPKDGKKKPYMTTVWKTEDEIKHLKEHGAIDKKTEQILHPTTGKKIKAYLHNGTEVPKIKKNDGKKSTTPKTETPSQPKPAKVKKYKRMTKAIEGIIRDYIKNGGWNLKGLVKHLKDNGIEFEDKAYLKNMVAKFSEKGTIPVKEPVKIPKPIKDLKDKVSDIKEESVVVEEDDPMPKNKENSIIIKESYCESISRSLGCSRSKALRIAINEAILNNPKHDGIYFKPTKGKKILQEESTKIETSQELPEQNNSNEIGVPDDAKISPFAMSFLSESERSRFSPELLQADANRYKKTDFSFQMDEKRFVELKGFRRIYGKKFPLNFSYDKLKINGKYISLDWLLKTGDENVKRLYTPITKEHDTVVGFTGEVKSNFANILSEIMKDRKDKKDTSPKDLNEATQGLKDKVDTIKTPKNSTEQVFRSDSSFNNTNENFSKTLYTKDSNNKLRFWEIECQGSKYRTRSGMFGDDNSKYDWSKWTTAKGKNAGKKNATTPEKQANLEANSKVRSQLNEGRYFESLEEAKKPSKIIFPMLAEKYEEKKKQVQEYLKSGGKLYVQPKLDGIRCVVSTEGRIHSRNNEDIKTQPQLRPLLDVAKKHNVVFDGELYNHDYATEFGTVQSLVRNESQQEELRSKGHKLEYHIYDAYFKDSPNMNFKERFDKLKSIPELKPLLSSNDITFVDTKEVSSEKQADDLLSSHLDNEYEGSIVRMNTPYEVDKRTNNLLKRKMFDDDEFVIHDIEEGKGNSSGMAGRVIFKNKHTGGTFASGFEKSIKANAEFKKDLLKNKHKYIGKQATVNYMGLHDGKVPRHPRVKAIHEGARM